MKDYVESHKQHLLNCCERLLTMGYDSNDEELTLTAHEIKATAQIIFEEMEEKK